MENEETKKVSDEKKEPSVGELLSVVSMGPLTVMISRNQGALVAVIKRVPQNPKSGDRTDEIPIIEIPALIMLLKAVAEPAMTVRSLTPVPGQQPAAKATKGKKAKK